MEGPKHSAGQKILKILGKKQQLILMKYQIKYKSISRKILLNILLSKNGIFREIDSFHFMSF